MGTLIIFPICAIPPLPNAFFPPFVIKLPNRETQISFAFNKFQSFKKINIRAAVKRYNIPFFTLYAKIKGVKILADRRPGI